MRERKSLLSLSLSQSHHITRADNINRTYLSPPWLLPFTTHCQAPACDWTERACAVCKCRQLVPVLHPFQTTGGGRASPLAASHPIPSLIGKPSLSPSILFHEPPLRAFHHRSSQTTRRADRARKQSLFCCLYRHAANSCPCASPDATASSECFSSLIDPTAMLISLTAVSQ